MAPALIVLLALPIAPATATADLPAPVAADVAYHGDAPPDTYAAERCRLDVYRPEGAEGYPTVVFFHGGGLRDGDRRSGDPFAGTLVAEGVGVVLVDYRLSPRATCPAYLDDAAAAVAWTLDHIGEYGGDPGRVFVSGHSAGGYLAAMIGLDGRYLGRHDRSPSDLAGLIPIAGQMTTHSTIRAERGLPEDRPLIDELAPCHHVRADAPPILCIAADDDLPARAEENAYFAAVMTAVGHDRTRCLVISGRDHGSIFSRMAEPGDEGAAALLDFIRGASAGR